MTEQRAASPPSGVLGFGLLRQLRDQFSDALLDRLSSLIRRHKPDVLDFPILDVVVPSRKPLAHQGPMLGRGQSNDQGCGLQIDDRTGRGGAATAEWDDSTRAQRLPDEGGYGVGLVETLDGERAGVRAPVNLPARGKVIENLFRKSAAVIVPCTEEQGSSCCHQARAFSYSSPSL